MRKFVEKNIVSWLIATLEIGTLEKVKNLKPP